MMGLDSATNLVGGTMQAIAASQANKAMGTATKREYQRQQGYRNEAFDAHQTGLQGQSAEQANTDIAKGAETRQALYKFVNSLSQAPGQAGITGRDLAHLNLRGAARGRLGGYSDWALNRLIRNIRTQDELNRITNFAGGTASVFPARLYDAQHSWDELAFWGQLIQSLGGGSGFQPQAGGPPAMAGRTDSRFLGPTAASMGGDPGYSVPSGGADMFSMNSFGL